MASRAAHDPQLSKADFRPPKPQEPSMFAKQTNPTPSFSTRSSSEPNLSGTITPLNSSPDSERSHAVGAVVESFRNLHASVVRFISMLDDVRGSTVPRDGIAECPLAELLPLLEKNAREVSFGRIDDLMSAIEIAQVAEQQRDLIFSASLGNDLVRLQEIARSWERLDTIFVGLCVEHVMEIHYHGHLRDRLSA